jgi:hypothetical protein
MLSQEQVQSGAVTVSGGEEVYVVPREALLPQKMVGHRKRMLEGHFQFWKKSIVPLLLDMKATRVDELHKPCGIYIRIDFLVVEAAWYGFNGDG